MVAAFGVLASAQAVKKPVVKKHHVFFVEPKNNATVTSPLHMKFGSEGIEIPRASGGRQDHATSHRPLSRRYRSELHTARKDHREGHAVMGAFRRWQV